MSKKLTFYLRILYVSSLTVGFTVGALILITMLYFGDAFNATPLQIGIILSVSGFVGLTCNLYAGKLSDRFGRKPIIALGNIPARLSNMAIPFAPTLVSAAGISVFQSFNHNVAMPATRALIADIVPEKVRGKLFGRRAAFFSFGTILGSVLSTGIYDVFRFHVFKIAWFSEFLMKGIGIPYLISGIVGLFSLFLLLIFVEEPIRRRGVEKREND